MVRPNNQNIAGELSKLTEKETAAVAGYISQILSSRLSKARENQTNSGDELIAALSDAHENKRARQVFEWERTRRQNAQRNA